MRVPIGVPGGGVWGPVQVGGGGWVFLCKMREMAKGGDVGPAKELASQYACICQNYPLVSPRAL